MRLKYSIAIILSCLSTAAFCNHNGHINKSQSDKRPNIIFLLTDDQRWDALGVMGNNIIKPPNIDQLANKGLLFENAYVTTSICCVSRASLLTGQYESRHNINNFNTDLSREAVQYTYPILLKKQGYKIGFVNKYGVGGKDQPKELYDYWTCTKKKQPDYLEKDKQGNLVHNTDSCGRDIKKFLNQFGHSGPFCLSVSFKAPHELDGHPPKYVVQDEYKDLYKNVTIPEPLTAAPKYWNSFPDFFRTDTNIGRDRWKTFFSTPERFQNSVKDYYRLVTGVDAVVGNMVAQLKKMGLDKNTIIVFMGDNGFFLGEHGMEGKWYGYEESIRVPLVIYDPRLPAREQGQKIKNIALNVDIAPTILSMAGAPVPERMQGLNLMDVVSGKIKDRTDFFYEHRFMKSPQIPQEEGVVSTNYKYMLYIEHGYEELFDLKKDPHETTNLASNPKYKAKLEEMRKRYKELKAKAA